MRRAEHLEHSMGLCYGLSQTEAFAGNANNGRLEEAESKCPRCGKPVVNIGRPR